MVIGNVVYGLVAYFEEVIKNLLKYFDDGINLLNIKEIFNKLNSNQEE